MKLDEPTAADDEWYRLVEAALRCCTKSKKTGEWHWLAASSLAQTPLLQALVAGPTADLTRLGMALYFLLQWAINQLKPTGEPDWAAYTWRGYCVLYYATFEAMTPTTLATRLAISEQTVYQSRRKAIARLANFLADLLPARQPPAALGTAWAAFRYQQYDLPVRQLLCLVAVQEAALAWAVIQPAVQTATGLSARESEEVVAQLLVEGALIREPITAQLLVTPFFAQALNDDFPHDCQAAHQILARTAEEAGDFLRAATHWRLAGAGQQAAALLLTKQRALIRDGQVAPLLTQIHALTANAVTPRQWGQLKLLAGDLALQLQDVPSALAEYQHALQSELVELRAAACHRRARALLSLNLDEALLHYELASQALADQPLDHPLRIRVQTDKAWLFIQEKADLTAAERILRQLEEQISATNRLGASYLANAWAGFYHQRGEDALALTHRLRAWELAQAAQDHEWLMHTSRNLGNDYLELHHYEQARAAFAQSRELAITLGDRAMWGMNEKAIGECHFWLGDQAQALACYRAAYGILKAAERKNWLAYVCYDLAELYGQQWEVERMHSYLAEGMALCQQVRNQRLLTMMAELDAAFRWYDQLNERQQVGIKAAKELGAITKRDYQLRTGCAQRQAVRDLNELCALGLLRREGEGRAVRYVAPTNVPAAPTVHS